MCAFSMRSVIGRYQKMTDGYEASAVAVELKVSPQFASSLSLFETKQHYNAILSKERGGEISYKGSFLFVLDGDI